MMLSRRFKFYILRLKNANINELIYRFKVLCVSLKLKYRLAKNKVPTSIPSYKTNAIKRLHMISFHFQLSDEKIESLILKATQPDANQIKISDIEKKYKKTFFSDIDIYELEHDIRDIWEQARLQNLTKLILYSSSVENVKIRGFINKVVKENILRWIGNNQFPFGLNYISVMECGLRIPVFFYYLKLSSDLSPLTWRIISNNIYLHAWWISERMSLYSSRGNHTVAESVGLIFAGAIFQDDRIGRAWLKKGLKYLKQELQHQINTDGGPAEQSVHYHRFILDLFWLAIDFCEKNGIDNFQRYKALLLKGEAFSTGFQDVDGTLIPYGDSDNGFAMAPGIKPRVPWSTKQAEELKIFQQSGYSIVKIKQNIHFVFNHGPLGMPPFYNHGHADALSITLSKANKKFFIDPGTYRYNGDPKFRKYFRGTRAHNTVAIDGKDQAKQLTRFIWSNPYDAKLIRYAKLENGSIILEAVHNGYSRLKKPVWHRRIIVWINQNKLLIKDNFEGSGRHQFELNFHLHPNVHVDKSDNCWTLDHDGIKIYMTSITSNNFVFVKGRKNPCLGWYSQNYGKKESSGVLNSTITGTAGGVVYHTLICTEQMHDINKLKNDIL
jgi:heparinase II/III-like protein